jgi:hypothetical protein
MYNGVAERSLDEKTRTNITMQDYYCDQFHYRPDQPNPFLSYDLLSSKAKVEARACIDANKLSYILTTRVIGDVPVVIETGKTIILHASYTVGRRYMIQNYHDSIAICRVFGALDFFFTFTCNPK